MSNFLRLNRLVQTVVNVTNVEQNAVRTFTTLSVSGISRDTSNTISKRWSSQNVIKSFYTPVQEATKSIHERVWQDVDKWASKTATVCGITGRSYKYEEARDKAHKFAKSLLGLGLKPGNVVSLLLPNVPEYPIAFLGALEAGMVVTTLNPMYTPVEVASQLKDCGSVAAITMQQILPLLPTDSLRSIIVLDEGKPSSGNMHSFTTLIKNADTLGPSSLPNIDVNSTAAILYSSGTTGIPKGVELTHKNIAMNIAQFDHPELSLCTPATDSFQENVLALLPMYHVYALTSIMLARMCMGGQLVTLPKFEPSSYISALDKNKFTMLYLVPPLLNFMACHPEMQPHLLEAVRVIVCGAAPLSTSSQHKLFEKTQCTAVFQEGYGMTESSPIISVAPKDPKKAVVGSCGNIVANTELKVVHIESGKVLPCNQTGEVCVRGPQVMKGYLNNPKATEETIDRDGWLHTGDLGYVDENKFLFIVDRLKELIKVKGLQVAPAELEEILLSHSEVQDAAVIGIPDERSGEVPRAFVVSSKSSKEAAENIAVYVQQKVAPFKKLAGGVVFVDSIPKSPAGKILRKQLKEHYLKGNS